MNSEVRTLCDIFRKAAASGRSDLLIAKRNGAWRPISAEQFGHSVRALSLGLNALGIQPNQTVALLSENRPEWAMSDYAIVCAGAWTVPIYTTLPAAQVEPLLVDCKARAIIVSPADNLAKVESIHGGCPELEYVIAMEGERPRKPGYLRWHDVVEKGRPALERSPDLFERRASRVRPEDVATIIYTSGTTGEPKGAMLTHGNLVSNVVSCCSVIPFDENTVALSSLPLSHVFERMLDYSYLYRAASIAYAESTDMLRDNFLEVNPVTFGAVPRVYEKIHAQIMVKAAQGSGIKKRMVRWALQVGRERLGCLARREPIPPALERKYRWADRLVFHKIRAAFGTRFRFAVSGGAPLARELAEFFWSAGIKILEGYGLTETSPVISVNRLEKWKLGTLGPLIPGVEVRIGEDGEILTRGPHVMRGYFGKPQATAEAIDPDGWFHTGDIGEIDAEGFLKITDRKKDLIVLSGGKKAAPQPLENELKRSPFIETPVILGDRHKFLIALIVPNVARLRQQLGRETLDPQKLDSDPAARALMQKEIDAFNAHHPHHEQIRAFALLPEELSIESGAMTPTLKVKRRVVERRYHALIENLYREKEATPA